MFCLLVLGCARDKIKGPDHSGGDGARGGWGGERLGLIPYLSVSPPVSPSDVDDAESECGLDSGIEFDWIISNEADAPSLDEQLQPILRLAEEAASSITANHCT